MDGSLTRFSELEQCAYRIAITCMDDDKKEQEASSRHIIFCRILPAFGGLCLKRSIDSEVHAHPTSPKTNGLQKHVICILKEMWCTSLSLPRNTGPGGKGGRHDENNGSPLHGPLMQQSRRNVTVLKLCHIYFFCQYLFQNRWPSGEDEEHGAPARCFSLGCRISGAARLFGPLIREGRGFIPIRS